MPTIVPRAMVGKFFGEKIAGCQLTQGAVLVSFILAEVLSASGG